MSPPNTNKQARQHLKSPLSLPALLSPGSKSSLSFSPAALSPLSSRPSAIPISASGQPQGTQAEMPSSAPWLPEEIQGAPSAHSRAVLGAARPSSPRYSRTRAMRGVFGGRSMSRVLQQVLGLREPELFAVPVVLPVGLEELVLGVLGEDEKVRAKGEGGLEGIVEENEDERGLGDAFASMTTLAESFVEKGGEEGMGVEDGVFFGRHHPMSLTTDMQEQGVEQQSTAVPDIRIEAPSPSSGSLTYSSSADTVQPDLPQTFSDANCGLPITAEERPEGNTKGLLEILLNWSVASHALFKKMPDRYFFGSISVFPRRWQPPLHQELVSVAFYGTSTSPHTEIRYIGPGDVAKMSYNEVDTFTIPAEEDDIKTDSKTSKASNILSKAKKKANSAAGNPENTRWAYILLKDHIDPNELNETPAMMTIAWPISSTTSRSSIINVLRPETTATPTPSLTTAAPPLSSSSKHALPRYSSLQNLSAAFSRSANFHQALRSAESSTALRLSELQDGRDVMEKAKLEIEGFGEEDGAKVFKREVMVLGKKGGIPLVEGYKIDVRRWEGWLGAVGRGNGKVVCWRDGE